MSSLRIAWRTSRLRPVTAKSLLPRRGYAEAIPDRIKLTLTLPHQVRDEVLSLELNVAKDSPR